MIQLGSMLKVTDKTGVVVVQCIKVIKNSSTRIARIGEMFIVSVQIINPKKFVNVKVRYAKRYLKGTLHRGLLIRSRVNYRRLPGVYIKFNENTVVLVTKKVVPVSNRIYGPIFMEFCMRWPSLGCVANCII